MDVRQKEMLHELQALLCGYWLSDLANFAAFFYERIPNINWIGFYLNDGTRLRLGPFAGKPACVEIAFDRGVCGTAFTKREPLVVADVYAFPGHIACDPASRSELVIPIQIKGEWVGVLDVDSPLPARFGESEVELLQEAVRMLQKLDSQWKMILQ